MMEQAVVKWTGCILLFLLCAFLGYREAWRLKGRYRELELFGQIILLIRGEVRYGNTPLPEVFLQTGKQLRAGGGRYAEHGAAWLSELAERLVENEKPFEQIWQESILEYWENTCLSREDLQLLYRFGSNLGYMDRTLQLELMEYYLQQFDRQKAAAAERSGIYGRVYRGLGILGGAFLLVLIL